MRSKTSWWVHIIINHMYIIILSNINKNIPTFLYIMYNKNVIVNV